MNYKDEKKELEKAAVKSVGYSDGSFWENYWYKGFLKGCEHVFENYEVKKKEKHEPKGS